MGTEPKLFLRALFLFVITTFAAGCHGSSTSPGDTATLTTEQIQTKVTASNEIPSSIISSLMGILSSPSDSGSFDMPPTPEPPIAAPKDKTGDVKKVAGLYDFAGPDNQGWYTRTYSGGYGGSYMYTEKVRYQNKTLEYKMSVSYSGTDGSYSYTLEFKCARNDNGLLTGYYDIQVHSNSNYSDTNTGDHFRVEFTNCDPETGAGLYDWYDGGDINSLNPYSHYMHMNAVDAGQGELHVYLTTYGDYGGTWDYYCLYQPINIDNLDAIFGS